MTQGILQKMHTIIDDPVQYHLSLGEQHVPLNCLIGQMIKLTHSGRIECIHCHKVIKKTYHQGYCYPCFISLAQCDLCILKPHTCHYANGSCREPAWGEQFCFQEHYVYLANSSDLKVGITRATQIPTRWIDQGASQALPIFKTSSRQIAGFIEEAISHHVSDKTNWQKLLKNQATPIDLPSKRDELVAASECALEDIFKRFGKQSIEYLRHEKTTAISFPITEHPCKIKSLCLIKTPQISGILHGIKGQYLILDSGVINIRKYTGYDIHFDT